MKGLLSSIGRNAVAIGAGGVAASACQFGSSIALAWMLGTSEFGNFVIVQVGIVMLNGLILPVVSSFSLALAGRASPSSSYRSLPGLVLGGAGAAAIGYGLLLLYDSHFGSGLLWGCSFLVHIAACCIVAWSGAAQALGTMLNVQGRVIEYSLFMVSRAFLLAGAMLIGGWLAGSSGAILSMGAVAALMTVGVWVRSAGADLSEVGRASSGIDLRAGAVIATASLLPSSFTWRANTAIGDSSGMSELGLAGYSNVWRTAAGAGAVFLNQALLPLLRVRDSGLHRRRLQLIGMTSSFVAAACGSALVWYVAYAFSVGPAGVSSDSWMELLFMALSSLPAASLAGTFGTVLWLDRRFGLSLCLNAMWSFVFGALILSGASVDALHFSACMTVAYSILAGVVVLMWLLGLANSSPDSRLKGFSP